MKLCMTSSSFVTHQTQQNDFIYTRNLNWQSGIVGNFIHSFDVNYTSNSLSSLLIFTKSLSCSFSYKKFCFSSSSVGVVGDWFLDGAGEGPLIDSVGNAAKSFLGVFFVLIGILCVNGSLWHSTISMFSLCSNDGLVSSLSQILFDGFSEKRRCWEIKQKKKKKGLNKRRF